MIATDATLTKAQCAKVSGIGHDGLARAINPVHTMFDGDTVFTLATGGGAAPDPVAFHALLEAAATCVTRAVARGRARRRDDVHDPPAAPRRARAPRSPRRPGPAASAGTAARPTTTATPAAVPVRSYRDAFPSAF